METFNIYKWIESTKQLLAEKDWEAVSKEKSKLKRYLKKYSEVGSKAIYIVKRDSILYRGRIYKEEDRFRRWADYDSSEGQQFRGYGEAESFINLDVAKVEDGRCNRKNEPCLYVSEKRETCYVELRPQANTLISLAEIIVTSPLKVLDLSSSGAVADTMEMAETGFALNLELNRPVYDSENGYAFTQLVAECVKELGFDGVRYSSAFNTLTHRDRGKNMAIFNFEKCKACSSELVLVNSVDVCVEYK